MIVGTGIDIVSLERFHKAEERPGSLERLFSAAELAIAADFSQQRATEWYAGRFAAKEALAKAISSSTGLSWTDCEVISDDSGKPHFRVSGLVAARIAKIGASRIHLTISHDAGVAIAFVILESATPLLEA